MEICNEHDIVYNGRECPACLIEKDRDYFNDEVGSLEKELKSAEEYILKLEEKIAELEAQNGA